MPTRTIAGPAGSLHVEDEGEGAAVLFLHSFAGNAGHWAAQINHLRGERRAIALDLRGHGRSDPPPDGDYAIASMARDVAAVVDTLGVDAIELVGHSIGGCVACAYAGAHAERVSGLLLVGTPGRTLPEQARQIMDAMKADYAKVTGDYWAKLLEGARPEVGRWISAEMNTLPESAALAIIEAAFAYDPVPDIERFAGPTLSITTVHGDGPGDLGHLLPRLPHLRIDGTSHWPHLDRPDEFNRLMDDFIVRTAHVEAHATDRP